MRIMEPGRPVALLLTAISLVGMLALAGPAAAQKGKRAKTASFATSFATARQSLRAAPPTLHAAVHTAATAAPGGRTPKVPSIGIPIQTIQPPGNQQGIMVGSKLFDADTPDDADCPVQARTVPAWIQMLVLDRRKLVCKRQYVFARGSANALKAAVTASKGDEILVITGGARGQEKVLSGDEQGALKTGYRILGGTWRPMLDKQGSQRGFHDGFWSLIGSRDLDDSEAGEGTAWQNQGLRTAPQPQTPNRGSLDGFMQINGEKLFSFVSPHYVSFDTDVPNQRPGTNAIRIGEATYTSTPKLKSGESGLHVIALDQTTLSPLDGFNKTYVTNGAVINETDRNIKELVNDLNTKILEPEASALVIVQTIGDPSGGTNFWTNDLATVLGKLGATTSVIRNLRGHNYSLVGGTHLPVFTPKNSELHLGASGFGDDTTPQFVPGSKPRMTGVLSQNRQSQYSAGNWMTKDILNASIYDVTYGGHHENWPVPSTPGQEAAFAFVAAKLAAADPTFNANDLRASYVGTYSSTVFLNARINLGKIQYPDTRGTQFKPADLNAVTFQLGQEFQYVSELRDVLAAYKQFYTQTSFKLSDELHKVVRDVKNSVDPPSNASLSVNMGLIGQGILTYLQAAAGSIPFIGGVVGGAIGDISAVNDIVSAFQTKGGVPITGQIDAKAADLETQLVDGVFAQSLQLDQFGDIIVGDWGRLRKASTLFLPHAQINADVEKGLSFVLGGNLARMAYSELVPLAYAAYDLRYWPKGDSPGPDANQYTCSAGRKVFPHATPDMWFNRTNSWKTPGHPEISPWLLAFDRFVSRDDEKYIPDTSFGDAGIKYPSKTVLAGMFGPLSSDPSVVRAQLSKPHLFEQYFPYWQLKCDPPPP